MRVPMKVDYGVRALVELAQHFGQGLMPTAEIAKSQNMPEPFLDQVLHALKKGGFVRSRRGPQGGHVLAKDPGEISLRMVVGSLEGAGSPLICIEDPTGCTLSGACAQREMWQTVESTVDNVLSMTTIADLAVRQRHMASGGMYYI